MGMLIALGRRSCPAVLVVQSSGPALLSREHQHGLPAGRSGAQEAAAAQEAAGLGRAGHTALPAAPAGTAARLRAQLRGPGGKARPAREGPVLPARRPPFLLAAAHCSGTELMGQDSPFPDFH